MGCLEYLKHSPNASCIGHATPSGQVIYRKPFRKLETTGNFKIIYAV